MNNFKISKYFKDTTQCKTNQVQKVGEKKENIAN